MDRIEQKEYTIEEDSHWETQSINREEIENLEKLIIKYPNSVLINYLKH